MPTSDLRAHVSATRGRSALELVPSVCPHDCTSTCAFDVERLDARSRESQRRGVAVVEGIGPNKHFEGGIGINAVTSAEPGYPKGGAVFHDTAVWVRRA
jgi:hypothetical protein